MKTDDSRFWPRLPQLSAISTAGLTAVLLCMSQPARAQLPPLPDEAATDETAMDETAIDEMAVADGPTSDTPAYSPVLTGATAETDVPALPQSFVNAQGYSEYVLGPSDQILLSVVGYPEFEGGYVVLPDGTVTLPLVGSIPVAGRSLDQIDAVINERLKYYLVDPVVDVGLATLRPVIVSVSGAVHRPGPVQLTSLTNTNSASDRSVQQDFTDGLPTLSSALLAAGGVTHDADIRVVTVRRLLPGGQMQSITIDLWEAIQAEGVGANFVLRDGDTVFIPRLDGEELDRRLIASSSIAPETIGVRVVGEVKTPGEIRVSPDSSVSGAVAAAGGPTSDANLGNVVLVRMDESGEVTQQPMDLSNLIDNYQVQEGDVVLVAKRGYLSFFDTLGRVLNPLNLFGIFGN